MKFVRTLLSAIAFFAASASANDDILRDVQLGMQGLQQASNDPALLAQLMQDMQNPELMAEAQRMMADPKWQKEMKKLTNSKEFKDSINKAKDLFKDPNAQAHAEAKMEHMLNVGQEQLQAGAAATMQQAMQAMNDPAVMGEMVKMLKDPKFATQLEAMAKDPQFQNYVNAMQDMMKDPNQKKQFDAAREALLKASR